MIQMAEIKQKILRLVLAASLVLAPMAPAMAVSAMDHPGSRTANVDMVDHGTMHHSAAAQQDAEHCAGNHEKPGNSQCQHSCCGHCSLSMTFVLPQSTLAHNTDIVPPFNNALQASFTAFTHYRPPA